MLSPWFGPEECVGYLFPPGNFTPDAWADLGQGPLRMVVVPGEAAVDLEQAVGLGFQSDELRAPTIEELVMDVTFTEHRLGGLTRGEADVQ